MRIVPALLLAGCFPIVDIDSTGSKSDLDSSTSGAASEVSTTLTPVTDTATEPVPVFIMDQGIHCDESARVYIDVLVDGPSPSGLIFAQETANAEPQRIDMHNLEPRGPVSPNSDTLLEQLLFDGSHLATPDDAFPNQSTFFTCQEHFENPDNVMTYAVYALDGDEVLDCIIFGHDPEGLANGSYERLHEPIFDPMPCRIVPSFL